jgi:hypothetical protein
MPVLQRIQQDLSETRRGLEGKISALSDKFDGLAKRMEAFEGYFTDTMGLKSRNSADIETLQRDVRDLRRGFDAADPKK